MPRQQPSGPRCWSGSLLVGKPVVEPVLDDPRVFAHPLDVGPGQFKRRLECARQLLGRLLALHVGREKVLHLRTIETKLLPVRERHLVHSAIFATLSALTGPKGCLSDRFKMSMLQNRRNVQIALEDYAAEIVPD